MLNIFIAFVVGLVIGAVSGAIGGYYVRKNNPEKVDAAMTEAENVVTKK